MTVSSFQFTRAMSLLLLPADHLEPLARGGRQVHGHAPAAEAVDVALGPHCEGGEAGGQFDAALVALEGLLGQSRRLGLSLGSLHIDQPNLEDVFLQHTGRTIRD